MAEAQHGSQRKSLTQRREAIRAILAGTGCIHPASVHDPISARIAQEIGFECGMYAGSTASLAILGAPDLILLTLTEFAEQARRITRACDLPVIADADHGYGNALNTQRTIEELETAGIAALSIEDTDLPRPHGAPRPRLIPLDEGLGKIRAAVAARQDPALVIMARTGAVSITGLDDAITRIRAYATTGADALFLTGVTTRHELDTLAGEAKLPLFLGTLSEEISDRAYLASRGVRIALQGHAPFQAATEAIRATLQALRDGTPPKSLAGLAPPDAARRWTREAEHAARMRAFLGG
ncbi:MAG: isocitrate lyase/PEP mutase family protein [Acetobacteraceae bacterium]|nr:isocitrate lyase/PEP mutase family protein [Acetobacteraceae bacterium]